MCGKSLLGPTPVSLPLSLSLSLSLSPFEALSLEEHFLQKVRLRSTPRRQKVGSLGPTVCSKSTLPCLNYNAHPTSNVRLSLSLSLSHSLTHSLTFSSRLSRCNSLCSVHQATLVFLLFLSHFFIPLLQSHFFSLGLTYFLSLPLYQSLSNNYGVVDCCIKIGCIERQSF